MTATGFGIVKGAFQNVGRAAPPTPLVVYEDLVAVTVSVSGTV